MRHFGNIVSKMMQVLFVFRPVLIQKVSLSSVGACCATNEILHYANLAGNCASAFVFMLVFVVEHLYLLF